jgi:hypothetical protein
MVNNQSRTRPGRAGSVWLRQAFSKVSAGQVLGQRRIAGAVEEEVVHAREQVAV